LVAEKNKKKDKKELYFIVSQNENIPKTKPSIISSSKKGKNKIK
jgi:hypothetical protein